MLVTEQNKSSDAVCFRQRCSLGVHISLGSCPRLEALGWERLLSQQKLWHQQGHLVGFLYTLTNTQIMFLFGSVALPCLDCEERIGSG